MISLTPANSSIARTEPPAIIPVPALAGLIKTLAAPDIPIASWETVLSSTKSTLIMLFVAFTIAFFIASWTSFALPVPRPTLPFPSPTATVAAKRRRRPPLVTFVTRFTEITVSLYSFSRGLLFLLSTSLPSF